LSHHEAALDAASAAFWSKCTRAEYTCRSSDNVAWLVTPEKRNMSLINELLLFFFRLHLYLRGFAAGVNCFERRLLQTGRQLQPLRSAAGAKWRTQHQRTSCRPQQPHARGMRHIGATTQWDPCIWSPPTFVTAVFLGIDVCVCMCYFRGAPTVR